MHDLLPGDPVPPAFKATRMGLKKLDAWLVATAKDRARNDWERTLVSGMRIERLSSADRSLLNKILYGDPDGVRLP